MYTLIVLLLFTAFFLCYNLSEKGKIAAENKILWQLRRNRKLSFALAATSGLLSLVWLLYAMGTGAGSFAFIIILMCMGSLILLIAPFGYIKWPHVLIFSIALFILEKIIF